MREPDERLDELPVVDVAPAAARRIHARARRMFVRQARLAGRPARAWLDRAWNDRLEPALVTALGAAQLVWVLETVRRLAG
jgi:hypothetical protein